MSSKLIHRDLPNDLEFRLRTWASTRFVELFHQLEQFAFERPGLIYGDADQLQRSLGPSSLGNRSFTGEVYS